MQQAAVGQWSTSQAAARRAIGPVSIGAVAFAVVLEAIGIYTDRSSGDPHRTREFLVVLAIIAISAVAVFGWIVPKLFERDAPGTSALVLSVLALASLALFWSGLPPILAAGGALVGWAGRAAPRGANRCRAAIAIGVLVLVADVVLLVLDSTNTL
jgi:hypothetical protein